MEAVRDFVSREQKELPIGWEDGFSKDPIICPAVLLSCLFLALLRKVCKNQLAGSGARLVRLAINCKLD